MTDFSVNGCQVKSKSIVFSAKKILSSVGFSVNAKSKT